ncbi:MAG: hypothetical protein JO035_06740 [Betaproteobacteria bacterium]|nr:hypothetical protein [Betaproteobacteria bacterium]
MKRIVYVLPVLLMASVLPRAALAAGSPTAVSNLPVVTADRHKVKRKDDKRKSSPPQKSEGEAPKPAQH